MMFMCIGITLHIHFIVIKVLVFLDIRLMFILSGRCSQNSVHRKHLHVALLCFVIVDAYIFFLKNCRCLYFLNYLNLIVLLINYIYATVYLCKEHLCCMLHFLLAKITMVSRILAKFNYRNYIYVHAIIITIQTYYIIGIVYASVGGLVTCLLKTT